MPDYEQLLRNAGAQSDLDASRREIEMARGAFFRMSKNLGKLTNSAQWNTFLAHATSMREEHEKSMKAYREKLLNGPDISAEGITEAKVQYLIEKTAVDTIDRIIEAVDDLVNAGDKLLENNEE